MSFKSGSRFTVTIVTVFQEWSRFTITIFTMSFKSESRFTIIIVTMSFKSESRFTITIVIMSFKNESRFIIMIVALTSWSQSCFNITAMNSSVNSESPFWPLPVCVVFLWSDLFYHQQCRFVFQVRGSDVLPSPLSLSLPNGNYHDHCLPRVTFYHQHYHFVLCLPRGSRVLSSVLSLCLPRGSHVVLYRCHLSTFKTCFIVPLSPFYTKTCFIGPVDLSCCQDIKIQLLTNLYSRKTTKKTKTKCQYRGFCSEIPPVPAVCLTDWLQCTRVKATWLKLSGLPSGWLTDRLANLAVGWLG